MNANTSVARPRDCHKDNTMKKMRLLFLSCACIAGAVNAVEMPEGSFYADASQTNGVVIVSGDFPAAPHLGWHAFDNDIGTKWLVQSTSGWLVYQFAGDAKWAVTNYVIVTGGDEPTRDPRVWQLEGSNNLNDNDIAAVHAATWTTVDRREHGGDMGARNAANDFPCAGNEHAYNAYRLNILDNCGANMIQLDDWNMTGNSGVQLNGVYASDADNDAITLHATYVKDPERAFDFWVVYGSRDFGADLAAWQAGGVATPIAEPMPGAVNVTLEGLRSRAYTARLLATSGATAVWSDPVTFSIFGAAPNITTLPVTGVKAYSAVANATLDYCGLGFSTADVLLYLDTHDCGDDPADWPAPLVFENRATAPVTATLSNLAPETTYYYRSLARNDAGWAWGDVNQFTTLGASGLWVSVFTGTAEENPFTMQTMTPANAFRYAGRMAYGQNFDIANFPGLTGNSNFALLFEGQIWLEAGATYTFGTDSDDGTFVYIDVDNSGTYVRVVDNGGGHGMQVRTGQCAVSETGYYNFILSFVQGGGGYGLNARWGKGAFVGDTAFWGAGMDYLDAAEFVDGLPRFRLGTPNAGMAVHFTDRVVMTRDNGVFSFGSTAADVGAASSVALLWGTEPGVFTSTNAITTPSLVNKTPFSIPLTELSEGTFACALAAYENNVMVQLLDAGLVVHTGTPQLACTADALESGTPGVVRITRADSANLPLDVNYTLGGTAEAGVDYDASDLTGRITIPAGASFAELTIAPLRNFAKSVDTTVVVTLADGNYGFDADNAPSATVTIANETPGENENAWISNTAGNASDPANWSQGRVPVATDDIFLGAYGRGNMTWDATPENGLAMTVASWTQSNYPGTVQFNTTYSEAGGRTI